MRKPYRTARPNPRLLEPRMVFDAAVAAVSAELAADAVHAVDLTRTVDTTESLLVQQSESLPQAPPPTRIAFVDASLLKDGAVPGLADGVALVALRPDEDGIAQISAALRDRSDISAIYLVTHGEAGRVSLGATGLDSATLALRAGEVAAWAPSLSAGADILLYGCQAGSGGEGRQLMQALANLTGADVAASANNTGPASLGGDWVLEQSTGVIDAPAFAAPDALAQFDALLNVSVSSNSLSGWIAVTPANSQNDGTGDQQTGSGSVSQDIVGDATYRAAYVKYDNGGTAGDLSDDWLAFRIRVNNQDSVNPATPSFKNFAFFGVDADNNGSVDFFAGIYNPANNSGRIGVYDANGSGNTGPSDTGINGTPIIKYDSATTGYASLYSVLASGDGSSFSGDADYFVSFQVRIADINANKAAFGLTSSLTQSTVLRYIVGTAAQDNAFNQDVSGVTGSYSGSTQTWGQLGAYTAPVQADGSVPLAASADYASATEKGGTSNGSVGVDPAGYLLANDAGTGISVTKVQAGAIVGASASTVSVGSTSALNASVVQGSYGTLTIGADGSYGYAVNNGLAAVQTLRSNSDTLTDSFTYRITDSAAGTSDATLTVTIHGANDAPVITSGSSGTVAENASPATVIYTVTATDVDAGDTKAYALKSGVGDQALLIIDSSTGAVTLKASADYETKASYSFTVVATDAAGLTDEKVVTVAVTNVNEAPVAVADTALATEKGGTANGSAGVDPTGNVLSNDTDVDAADTKTVTAVRMGSTSGTLGQALAGSYGSLTLNTNGSYSYAVNNSLSTVQALRSSSDTLTDTFSYTMRDAGGLTSASTLSITIRGANDAPVITSGSSGNVAENSSPAVAIYTATASDVDAADTKSYSLKAGVGDEALLNINSSTGVVTLKVAANFEAKPSYAFTVVATDGGGLTDEKLVTVAVTNVNEAPAAAADTALATEKGGTANGGAGIDPTGNVLSNDSDVDAGDTQAVSALSFAGSNGTVGQALAGSYGSLTLNADGSYAYALNNANATVQALRTSSDTLTETFSYTMRDAGGLTSTSTLSITIRGANDAPVITSGSSGTVAENASAATVIHTATATDVDAGDTKAYGLKSGVGDEALLNIDAGTGAVTLKASADYETKTSYNFTVVATDAGGLTNEKLVTVAVTNVNEAPVAVADTALATEKGGTANGSAGVDPTGNVLSNDTDVDAADTKTVNAARMGSTSGTLGQALAGSYGSLTLNADGSYAYALNNANATVQALRSSSDTLTEAFSYTMRDAGGLTSTGTLSITIRGANDAPFAEADSASATERGSAAGFDSSGNVLTNDADVDAGDSKAVSEVNGSSHSVGQALAGKYGSLTLDADGSYRYTVDNSNPVVDALNAGDTLTDRFSYTVTDSEGLTSTSTLAVTIHGANDAPLASAADARGVTVGEPMTPLTVPAFADVDSATLTYTATLADGSALPAWLSFDPASRTFSGTPPIGSEATLPVRVSGSDGSQSDHVDFSLVVANPPVPQAAGDAADANEAGGVANGNAGTDAGGDALDNDSGTRLTVTRVGAGTDLGGDALTLGNQNPAEIVGSYGTLSMQADGRFHYEVSNSQPAVQALNVGDTLTERFSYEVTDQAGQTSMATITITVHGTNDVPTAAAQSTTTVTNGEPLAPLTVPAFADVDNASLSYSATLADGRSLPAWLSFDPATRTFSGTPPSSFTGTLGVTVHGDDGHADASLHFNLVVVNPGAPIALDDTGRASEQGAVAGSAASGDLLANDSGTAIRVREVDAGNSVGSDATAVGDGSTLGDGAARINGSHGTLLVAADGSYRYELSDALPAVDALSGADTMTDVFAYQIADPSGQTAMALLTITIQGANDAPVITSERSGMVAENAENGVVIYIATAADVDSEDTQSYSLKSGVGDEALLNIDRSTGEVTLKVPADYEVQTSYDFTVVVTDAGGLTDERAVTVVVTNVNEAPVAAADTAVATEKGDTSNGGAGVDPTGNVLSNDSDVDAADAKTVTAVRLGGTSGELGQALAGSYGNLTLNADGSYEYRVDNSHPDVEALNAGATLTDIFSYTVRDADGLSSTSTLSITIRGANDAPVITSGSGGTVAENASAIMAIYTATASDVDAADTKSYSLKAGVGDEALLSMDSSTGAVTLRDPADFESKASYSFTVVATDAAGLTDEKLVTVAVSNVNEAPVAVADTALATEKGGTANGSAGVDPTGNVLSNDTDIDAGDTLTVSAVSVDGRSGTVGQALAGSYGVLSLNADGSYGYVLDNANAAVQALRNSSDTLTDTFSYTVRDADGLTSASSLTVTIHGANDAPVAAAVAASPLTGGAPMAPLVVPAFADVDSPVLNYTATLADGSALPSWLHFDASARTLTGTPPAAAGTLSVRITGDDGGAADSVIVSLVIHAPPQPAVIAPVPVLPLPPVANVLPVVAPAPAVSALAPVELPARLPEPTPIARATLAVTPAVPMEAGRLPSVAEPVATGELYTDSRGFRVMVQPSNVQQLSVFRGISDQFVERGSHVKFNLPQDAFMHARPDQVVRLSARLADGRPLPAWLQFDAADGSFTGSPPADFEGEVRISVVARDGTGHEAATLFRLNVEEPHAESGGSSFSASMRDALPFSPAMPPLPALPPDQSIESVLLMEPAA